MGEKITKVLRGQILTSIVYILLGAALAFVPVETVNIICKFVFGIMLMAAGVFHIIMYILERPTTTMFDLFSGVILVVFGIFLFYNPQIIVKVLPTLLGGFVLVDSVWTLRGAIRLKKAGSGAWKWLLLGSLIFIGLGVAMIVNPFTVVRDTVIFCGAIMLANGVLDLIFQLVLFSGIRKAEKRKKELEQAVAERIEAEKAGRAGEPVYEDWHNHEAPTGAPEEIPEKEEYKPTLELADAPETTDLPEEVMQPEITDTAEDSGISENADATDDFDTSAAPASPEKETESHYVETKTPITLELADDSEDSSSDEVI